MTVLAHKQELELVEYLENREQRAVVEREFQTAIEACIDIAELLITAASVDVPGTSRRARPNGWRAPPASGTCSHSYGHDIDDEQVFWHLTDDLHWFPTFLREIQSALDVEGR